MPRSVLVRQVMTTDVVTFSPEEPIDDAMRRLGEHGVDGGPVINADGHVVGVLTTDDLLVQETKLHYPTVVSLFGAYLELPSSHRRFEEELRRAVGATVGEVMHVKAVTCAEDDTLERAATLMHERHVSRLPVTREGRLVGIVARGDIIKALIEDSGGA
ncbi:MAG: CBS domain-containing protein [Actinobacteria bacterium]|nr:CBS domain-containing protein [Actinomycetota bacterium]MBI3257082.1 CBS domain-containing protein [Actinomycetota bacterium]